MNNVTSLHAHTRAPQLDAENQAHAQLWRTQSLPRRDAVEACVDHLAGHGATERAAETTTIQAYAELEGINKRHRIDISATTSHLLVVATPGGERLALTLADLLAMLSPQQLASRHLTFQPVGQRRLMMLDRQPATGPREVQA